MNLIFRSKVCLRKSAIIMVLVLSFSLFFISCGELSDRNNSVDPGSLNYNPKGTLSIQVNDSYGDGLEDVIIQIEDHQEAASTNASGRCELELEEGNYNILVVKEGFQQRSFAREITKDSPSTLLCILNGLPVVDTVWTITSILHENLLDYEFGYELNLRLSDYDGIQDINEIILYEPGSTTPITDGFSNQDNHYKLFRNFEPADMSSLFGQNLRLVITDDNNDSTTVDYFLSFIFYYLSISEVVGTITDNENSSFTTDSLSFVWDNPRHVLWEHWFEPQNFRFEILPLVSEIPLIDTLIYYENYLAQEYTYTLYDVPFIAGDRFNVRLTLYDPLGNYVRSYKKLFEVAGTEND